MKILYLNPKNRPVTAHSYSAGQLWACPAKYKIHKILGYDSREERSQLIYGQVVEAAMIWHHNTDFIPGSGVSEFIKLWAHYELDGSVVYSKSDGSWADLNRTGQEMLALYEVLRPSLPMDNAVFQLNYKKELFPDTEYAGLEFTSFLDAITEVRYDHPLLPKPKTIPENGLRKVVVDIKTGAKAYECTDSRIYTLDPQLRSYAWVSGISTVAFLVLVKSRSKISAGDKVSLLKSTGDLEAGKEYIVVDNSGDVSVLCKYESTYEAFQASQEEISGKGSQGLKKDNLTKFILEHGTRVPKDLVTKQKIQFLAAEIGPEDQYEAGEQIGETAIAISEAYERNFYPKKPGVRFPSTPCLGCDCYGECVGDPKISKERLIQISGAF